MVADLITNLSARSQSTDNEYSAAHWLGVTPCFKGLSGKDTEQLAFSLEFAIKTTLFCFSSFTHPQTPTPFRSE